ncbi:MAG: cystathionine gamma-synthase family protein [Spirochaetes bacterium]|nr:cystathionine gamma-synthase family protein [Spirochaetota bacterium]
MSLNGFTSRILHGDRLFGTESGSMHQPVHTSAAFGFQKTRDLVDIFQGRKTGYAYSRQANPTVAALERKITAMEDGVGTVGFATGMAAIAALCTALLKKGDHLVASPYLFGNTLSLFRTLAAMGIEVSYADVTDASRVERALRPETRLVFAETIANPVTQVADLAGLGKLCAARGIPFAVDNTMTGPWLFRPKAVGAAFSVHSLTKTISGHGDALGGSVTDLGNFDWAGYPNIRQAWRSVEAPMQALTQLRRNGLRDFGGTLSADAAHRIAVGAETHALRMERSCENAAALARLLEKHPKVQAVHFPGLPSHPQYERSRTLFSRPGTLLSFVPAAGIDPMDLIDRLRLVVSSTNLGDTRTLAIPVAPTIFHELGEAGRKEAGIDENLIRISVGIEDWADLEDDFLQALGS